jgi:DNA-directed RNA polymerase specialized sigma24 family protein
MGLKSWSSVVEALRGSLVKRAYSMTGRVYRGAGFPEPEDLAQGTIHKLIRAYGEDSLRDRPIGQLYSLAYRTLHRLVLDEFQRRREVMWAANTQSDDAPEPVSAGPGPEQMAMKGQRARAFHGCLSELTEHAQRFLTLSFELGSAAAAQSENGWPDGSTSNACHIRRKLIGRLKVCVRGRLDEPMEEPA